VSPDANIIFGTSIRPELDDEVIVTVVATGFDSEYYDRARKEQKQEEKAVMAEIDKDIASVKDEDDEKEEKEEAKKGDLPKVGNDSFVAEPKGNMWDSIKNDEDYDLPPTLRGRFGKKKQ
jgi:cell division protein FtsZ